MQDLISKVEALSTRRDDLTEWEQNFITGISERIAKYAEITSISDKQAVVIKKIWDKVSNAAINVPAEAVASDNQKGDSHVSEI